MRNRQSPATGDLGQRYEVRFFVRQTGEEKVMGWTDKEDGGALMRCAKIWPYAIDPFVVDRGEDRRLDGKR